MVQTHRPILPHTMDIETEKKMMWDILRTPGPKSLKQQFEESALLGNPTPELCNTFADIATRTLNCPQYKHLTYRGDLINDAIVLMMRNWRKAIGSPSPFKYCYQLTEMAAHDQSLIEYRQEKIKKDYAEYLELVDPV